MPDPTATAVPLPSAVGWAQRLQREQLRPGHQAIDATLGNGHDTLFLAQQTLPGGQVYGFDIQPLALESTKQKLDQAGIPGSAVALFCGGHEEMLAHLPAEAVGAIQGVMFNFGYLPGADKTCITRTETSLLALEAATTVLAPEGLITAVLYPGHPGGDEEAAAIRDWASHLDPRAWQVQQLRPVNPQASPPECWAMRKR